MSATQSQPQPQSELEPSMECQTSENRVPENSIRSIARAQTQTPRTAGKALPKPQILQQPLPPQQQQQLQQPTQYVINSVAMHAKATTAGVITGGTLHRVKSAQVSASGPGECDANWKVNSSRQQWDNGYGWALCPLFREVDSK